MTPDVHTLVTQLQQALAPWLVSGTISLNFNNGDFLTWDAKQHGKAPPKQAIDKLKRSA